jgi:hypothetical protein
MKSFDVKKQTDLVILDSSKAFDTVSHKKLLHKLNWRRVFIIMLSRIWSTPRNCFTDDNTKVRIFLHLFQNMIVENVVSGFLLLWIDIM